MVTRTEYPNTDRCTLLSPAGRQVLLLDESFVVLWHTSTLTELLGFESIVGDSGIDYMHPDDVRLVLELLVQVERTRERSVADRRSGRIRPTSVCVRERANG